MSCGCFEPIFINANGTPWFRRTSSVAVNDTNVIFTLPDSRRNFRTYFGILYVTITDTYTAPTEAVPVVLQFIDRFGAYTLDIVVDGTTPVTSTDLNTPGTKVFLVNGENKTAELLNL